MATRTKLTITYWNCDREILWVVGDVRKAQRIAARYRRMATVMGVRVGV